MTGLLRAFRCLDGEGAVCGECEDCTCKKCPDCGGTGTIAVAGPDSFGMYETDDCPTCNGPIESADAR